MDKLRGARHDGCATAQSGFARRNFVAHFYDCRRWWPDEGDTHVGDGLGKVGILGEKSVARVHGVGPALANHVQYGVSIEVALRSSFAAQGIGLVGQAHMQGVAVELGIDRNCGDAHFASRANDTDGDLTPIGNQDFLGH